MLKGAQLIDESLCRVTAKTRSTLAVDYARCMLAAGSYEQRCATPYESVFTSKLGLMMQEARDDMFNLYRTWSVEANRDLSIPEDHLAFELEFAAYVCDEVARCLKNGNIEAAEKASDAFEAFVTNHLANWVGKVCSALEGMAQTSFYQGVAKLTWGFIQEEFLGFKNDLEEAA
jgi:TorA maturation chaperone TorD